MLISEILKDFNIIYILVICHNYIPAKSLLKIQKDSFFQNTVNILLAYRKNNTKFHNFIYSIQHLLSHEENNVDIILGYFNANYLIVITMVENVQIYLQLTRK